MTIDGNGVHRSAYWAPDLAAPPPYTREEDYIERARELFDLAVLSATRDTPRVAIATSGGLRFVGDRGDGGTAWSGGEHHLFLHGTTARHQHRRRPVSLS